MHTVSDARKRRDEEYVPAVGSTSDYLRDLCRRKLALEEQVIKLRQANEALRKTIRRLSPDPIRDADEVEPVVQEWPLDEHGRFRT